MTARQCPIALDCIAAILNVRLDFHTNAAPYRDATGAGKRECRQMRSSICDGIPLAGFRSWRYGHSQTGTKTKAQETE